MAAMIDLLRDNGSDISDPWQLGRSFTRDDSRDGSCSQAKHLNSAGVGAASTPSRYTYPCLLFLVQTSCNVPSGESCSDGGCQSQLEGRLAPATGRKSGDYRGWASQLVRTDDGAPEGCGSMARRFRRMSCAAPADGRRNDEEEV